MAKQGKWFFLKMLFWECFEVILQTVSLHTVAHEMELQYILLLSSLLLINMISTPLVLYKSLKTASTKHNGTILAIDTMIDTSYFVLNIYFMSVDSLYNAPFIGSLSIAWPLFCIMMRIRSLSRLVLLNYIEDERERLPSAHVHFIRGGDKNRNKISLKHFKGVCIAFSLVFIFTLIQSINIISKAIYITAKCENELGKELWKGAKPKYIFRNGVFYEPHCSYEKIKEINAAGKQIKKISPYIEKCVKLKTLNLSHNALNDLPRELLLMKHIETVDLEGNSVYTHVIAQNMSFSESIPPFIAQHLKDSIISLDLSNNMIQRIRDPDYPISKYKKLKVLKLSNNKIGKNGLPWKITKLNDQLHIFAIDGNILSSNLNWAKKRGFQTSSSGSSTNLKNAVDFLVKFFNTTLLHLNISHNGFKRNHFERITYVFHRLKSLDASYNLEMGADQIDGLRIRLTTKLKDLHYLNLRGNKRIRGISLENLAEMEKRLNAEKKNNFIINGVGIQTIRAFGKAIRIHNKTYRRSELFELPTRSILFPAKMLDQIKENILMFTFQNYNMLNFTLESFCNFPKTTSITIYYAETIIRESIPYLCFPACMSNLTRLTFIKLKQVNINPSCFFQNYGEMLPHIKHFYLKLADTCRHNTPCPPTKGLWPEFIGANPSVLVIKHFAPINQFPISYGKIPQIQLTSIQAEHVQLLMPKEWKRFDFIEISIYGNRTTNMSVSHLEIMNASKLNSLKQLTGPLFRVGPDFSCVQLYGGNHNNSANAAKHFQNDWNVTCNLITDPEFLSDRNNRAKLMHKETDMAKMINCSLPTIISNTTSLKPYVPVICSLLHRRSQRDVTIYDWWECFSESFFRRDNLQCEISNF